GVPAPGRNAPPIRWRRHAIVAEQYPAAGSKCVAGPGIAPPDPQVTILPRQLLPAEPAGEPDEGEADPGQGQGGRLRHSGRPGRDGGGGDVAVERPVHRTRVACGEVALGL